MKRREIAALLLLSLACCSCDLPEAYIKADRATHRVIAPEYSRYVDADDSLTPSQKARRKRTLDSWRIRIEAEANR